MDMREQKFGIEIEMTGITRCRAAQVLGEFFGTESCYIGGTYKSYQVKEANGREWKLMSDASILCQRKIGKTVASADRDYSVELVSPICSYEDIPIIQEIVRRLRAAGAIDNSSVGIHIHVSAEPFDARTLINLVNIVAAKEDLIYKALRVGANREMSYCKRIETTFLRKINEKKPKTMEKLKELWYSDYPYEDTNMHYHPSRYHSINLHSVFSHGTVEFRAFNGSVSHAGRVKAYIQFCLSITAQALNQKYASKLKTVTDNDKYTFRVWLLRLGMIGDEFKMARKLLLENLEGCIAWKDPMQAVKQKERLRHNQETLRNRIDEELSNIGSRQTQAEDEQSSALNLSL